MSSRMELSDEAREMQAKELRAERRCTGCAHFKVCAIQRAFRPLMAGSFKEGTEPIDPDDLAKVCDSYLDMSASILTA